MNEPSQIIETNFDKAVKEFRLSGHGSVYRLNKNIIEQFNIKYTEIESANDKRWPAISIWRKTYGMSLPSDLEVFLIYDKQIEKYKWIQPSAAKYGKRDNPFLFDDLISGDTVFICSTIWESFALFNKAGIVSLAIRKQGLKVRKQDCEIFKNKTIVLLNNNTIINDIKKYVDNQVKVIGLDDVESYFYTSKKTKEELFQLIENTPYYEIKKISGDYLDIPDDSNYHQIIDIAIKKNYNLRFNEITNQIEYTHLKTSIDYKNLDDRIENDIQMSCRNYDELKRLTQTDLRMVTNSSLVKKFNPFLDYFENLDLSDETDYLSHLCDCITTDKDCEPYKNEYLKMWLVGFVAQLFPRIPKDDTWEYIENKYHVYKQVKQKGKNQYCLILQGKQGDGKTDFFELFANVFGHQYFYSGNIEPDNRDHIEKSTIMAIIHLDELADKIKNHKTLESYKSLVAGAHTVNIRKAYGRHNMTMFRHASFCASINDASDLLNDHSGARRWMILTGVKINQDIYKIPIDKLMAQLFRLYIGGFKNWYDDHDFMNKRNEKYQFKSIEEQLLLTAIGTGKFKSSDEEYMTSSQIGAFLLDKNPKYTKLSIITLGKICAKEFLDTKRKHGGLCHYNVRKPKDDENKQIEIKVDDNKQIEIKKEETTVDDFDFDIDF